MIQAFRNLCAENASKTKGNTCVDKEKQGPLIDQIIRDTDKIWIILQLPVSHSALALSNTSILRVPCISHVIQICLNELLGKLRQF
ncbi:uncharacterized protein EURHEDRAFT_294810 [Aspergillus ruber CBS 135680]|uniref:Uncharacterized protein n=1 Tax=Aspergillus ruber (strain CBS 135680) TaxID=1388766 RepID=A0A017SKI2_ASPRC|nr:uncharacterized protein EURHEDRAFT_294810 [Aspergillus ruber CBS 135680]EYE97463.1 hypothetical protein EURHEDRAFT_294810 [Aspergillus ruber CBS 135680]